jgi:hypothetical protein
MPSLPDPRDVKLEAKVRRHLELPIPVMDLHKIISELQAEKHRLDEAIQALERLSAVGEKTKRRGRPPRWLAAKAAKAGESSSAGSETSRTDEADYIRPNH